MARISTYAIDGTPVSSDKLIGTDTAGTVTKNYPLGDVADWLKSSGATAVLGQNNYLFQTALDPDEGRKIGSFSFENYGGDGTAFEDVTNLKFSASSSAGKYIADYLLSTVDQKIMLSQLDAPNNFGIYALVSLTQSSLEPTFYDAVLAFVDGNGALQGNESYGLATYSALNEAGGGTWGSITGDIDNQTDLVSYIDNAIAGVPVPPTPTLQSVTDEGNTTTNSISAQSINLNAENGGGIFNSTYSDVNILPKSNAFEFNVRTSSNTGKLRISTDGSLYLASNANSIKLGRLHSGQYPKGQLELGLNGSGYTAFFDADGVNELMRVDGATGNVGIGTTLPTEKLHVQGTAPKIKLHNTSGFETYIEAYTGSGYSGININRDFFINGYNGKTLWSAQGGLSIASQYFYGGYVNFRRRGGTTDLAQIGLENGSNTYFNTGNFGIGTTAPSAKLEVVPAALNQNILSLKNVYGTTGFDFTHVTSPGEGLMMSAGQNTNLFIKTLANGADEGIKFLNSSDTELLTILKDGNVGIGTTAPARKLHIHADTGTAYLQLTQASTGIGSNDGFQISMGASQVNLINRENGNIVFETNNTEKLRITSAGKVGIGTTAPTEKLHVSGNIRLGLLGSQGYYLSWGQNEVSSSGDFARIYGIRTDGAGNQAGHLVFQTKAPLSGNTPSERLRITDVGNVGIGTTTPSSLLTINSQDTLATGIIFDNAGSKGYLFGSGTTMNLRAGSNYGITISTTSAALHAFNGSGNFLINLQAPTAYPTYTFYADADTGMGRPSADTLTLYANGERMRIGSNGAVAIGSTNTATGYTLYVAGNVGVSGLATTGDITLGENRAIRNLGSTIIDIDSNNDGTADYFAVTKGGYVSSTTLLKVEQDGDVIVPLGNVGIGTTAPALQSGGTGLHINAPTSSEIKFTNSTTGTTASDGTALVSNGAGFTINNREAGSLTLGTNNSTRLYIDSAGNVGIGTTVPSGKLHIRGDNNQSTTGVVEIGTSGTSLRLGGNSTYSWIQTHSSKPLYINELGNNVIVNAYGGNVGIGTTAPTAKLHVVGTTSIIDNELKLGNRTGQNGKLILQGNNGPNFTIEGVNDTLNFSLSTGNPNGGVIQFADDIKNVWFANNVGGTFSVRRANSADTDNNSGGLFIEAQTTTASNGRAIYISADSNGGIIRSTSYGGTGTTGLLQFQVGGNTANASNPLPNTKMVLDASGNVGIGTTAPSEKLDVVGNVKADGAIAPVMRNEGDIKKVINPKGGQYSMGTGSATGALVIKFPDGIDLTDNYANYQFAIQIGAQTISPAEFFIQARWLVGGFNDLNGYATSAENFDYKISVGKDGTNKYLIIGETTTSWVRNSFIIKEVYVDYINPADIDVYRDGWEISIMSDISAITVDVSQAHSDYAYQAVAAVKKENAALTASSWNTIATLGSLSGAGVFVLKRLDQAILSFTVSESYGRRHLNVNYYTALNTTTIEGVRITTNGKVQVLLGTTYNSNWEINCYYAKNVTLTAEVADPADAAAQSIDITGNNVGEIHTDAFVINQALTVKTSTGTDTLYAANTGDVGIGTIAPDSKLHVKATSGIAFKVDPNSADKEWYIDTTNPDHLKKEGNLILNADPTNVHTSTKISFNIDGSNKASINSDGDLGVGTTAQTSKLHVDGTAMRQLRIGTAGGPSSNTDTSGAEGDIAYDDLYLYIKTGSGWGRVALDFAF